MLRETKNLGRALLVALALTGLSLPAFAAETVVDQMNMKFVPAAVMINAGDTIRFTNSDHLSHNVTIVSPDGTKDDKGMQNFKQDIVVAFPKAGAYQVLCKVHPMMKMTVTVK